MKIDVNDRLFSELKCMDRKNCQRCMKDLALQCCHIFSRRHYSTRFDEDNAVVLCYSCHQWFDTHKISACLWDESKRVFTSGEESFHFLVKGLGYTWGQLVELNHKSQRPFRGYKAKKKDISNHLRERINAKLDWEGHIGSHMGVPDG